jgi:hypothetical protein
MQTNNLKYILSVLIGIFLFCGSIFSQKKSEYLCPLHKGKILMNKKASQEWGTFIEQVEIKGKRPDVYSSSPGFIVGIDTSVNKRVYVGVEYKDYIFIYDNLLTTQCLVGQKIEKGQLLGRLKEEDYLLLRIKKGSDYIDPKKILPCKVIKVNH